MKLNSNRAWINQIQWVYAGIGKRANRKCILRNIIMRFGQ